MRRQRLATDRWVLALALIAVLAAPAGPARSEDAAPAPKAAAGQPEAKAPEAKPAEGSGAAAEDRPLSEAEEEKLDAEDEKRREQQAKDEKKWRAKTKEEAQEEQAKQVRTIGRRTGRFLTKASQLFSDRKYDESNEVLSRLNLKRLNPYERALVLRYEGYNAYGKEQHSAAIELLRKALAEKGPDGNSILKKEDTSQVLYQIAQMQMGTENYEDAIATLKEWFAQEEKPGGQAYFTLAIAYYQLKNLDAAIEPAKKAIEVAETPQQSWIQLLLAIYLNKEDYASATPVAAQLLSLYPDVGKAYWLQLATLYGVQKDIPRALAVMQIAHRRKLLDEDQNVRRLASLLQSEDIPMRSVHVLEQGFEQKILKEDETSYELLGNSWILAREADKAEKPLEKAAELSPKGALYVRLGQVRLLKEDYEGAASALKNGLAKGGLDNDAAGSAEMLLGITYYNAGKLSEAKTWFAKSLRSEKARPTAEQWIKHIDEQVQKQEGDSGGAAGSVGL
jgi:tetratricopeptide (TPR) repeat protein